MSNSHTLTSPSPLAPSGAGPDREVVSYVGRHGAVSIPHLVSAFGICRAAAYRRVAALIDAGLLERLDLLRGEPALLRATRPGLRYAGLGMAPAVVSPGSVDHWLRCASVALRLEALHGAHRILTARELIAAERHEERPIASAKIGELADGRPRLHRPDLVVLPEGHPLAKVGRLHIHGGADVDSASGSGDPDRDSGLPGPTSDRRAGQRFAAHPRTRPRGGSDPSEISGHQQREGSEAEALMRAREISGDPDRDSGFPGPSSPRTQGGGQGERTDPCVTRGRPTEDTGMRSVPGGLIAVEVELTPKSPKRLREIVRGWRRASWVAEVHYLCEPGQTRRAVERAVEKLHASDRVRITEVPR
jgi:hypothetical protein